MASSAFTGTVGAVPRPMGLPIALVATAGTLAVLGLFARIMSYPLRHDEQMYLPVGALLGRGSLYSDFGFNNFPNLPLLLHAVFTVTATDHYLLTARMIVVVAWLGAAAALGLLAWRATRSPAAAAVAILALVANPVLLGAPGMLVTNNFLPVPFVLFAILLFLDGLDRSRPSFGRIAAAGACLGLAAGFKANAVVLIPPFLLAASLVPRGMAFRHRLAFVVAPLAVGGIVGGLPLLIYFAADPAGFVAHTINYHRGPHIAYWTLNAALDGPKVMGLGGKLQLAETVWLSGTSLLIVVAGLMLGAAGLRRQSANRAPLWPLALLAGLIGCTMAVSFVPTPAFPQYYVMPIPLGIALVVLLFGRCDCTTRAAVAPAFAAITVLLLVLGGPRLLADLPKLVHPGGWTGMQAHAAGQRLAAVTGGRGPVATLAPIYPLEAGLDVYPELAAGPLAYRVGDLIPVADRVHYTRLVSPTTVTALLAARAPAAIVTGFEGPLDAPFVAFATSHGYSKLVAPLVDGRYGTATVYVRPRMVAELSR